MLSTPAEKNKCRLFLATFQQLTTLKRGIVFFLFRLWSQSFRFVAVDRDHFLILWLKLVCHFWIVGKEHEIEMYNSTKTAKYRLTLIHEKQ